MTEAARGCCRCTVSQRNVILSLVATALFSLCDSVWNGSVLVRLRETVCVGP